MATEIKLIEGDSITVREDYRDVYEKLLAAGWQEPCEFTHEGTGEPTFVAVNPSYIIYLRSTTHA